MPSFNHQFGHSTLRKIVAILAIGFCAPPAVAEPLAGPFTQGFVKVIARAHGYCIGQAMSVEAINRNFPDLSLAMQRAEMLFDAGTSNVCQTAMETLIAAVGAGNAQRLTEQLRVELAGPARALDRSAAIGFIHELEARAGWVIDAANLPAILAVRYGASPASEFTDGHVGKYVGIRDSKLLGVELSLKVPLSWKEMPGDRPHVVRKWVDQVGTGLNSIMLMVKDIGQPLGPQDLADFVATNPIEIAPDGSTFLDGGGFVLEGLSGIRTRVRVTMQRVDGSIDQIVEQFMLPLPTGRIVFLSCYSGAEVGAANTLLQRRFELIEPLCRQFVNSLVLTSIY